MSRRPLRSGLFILVALLCSGCTAGKQTFNGYAPNSVWRALQVAARLPDYNDMEPKLRWRIDANDVWVDEDGRRIEIHREVSRLEGTVIHKRTRRERVFEFEVLMVGFDPPVATMTAHGSHLPGQAAIEAERYFADVRTLLAATFPAVDIQDIDPGI